MIMASASANSLGFAAQNAQLELLVNWFRVDVGSSPDSLASARSTFLGDSAQRGRSHGRDMGELIAGSPGHVIFGTTSSSKS